jgi:hypothetical protein
VACAQIGVTVVHLELCGACGKLGVVGSFALVVVDCLVSVYLRHKIVFIRRFPLLGLTVVVVELSVFVFEINYSCTLHNFNRTTVGGIR